jgi:Zn-dependent M28 family amino/carboxypeptidase
VDNALGVAGVLELAGLINRLPMTPRRSIIFLFTTAEESGLLGSRYFLSRPPLPSSRMVANVNVDGLAFLDSFSDCILVGGHLSTLEASFKRALRPLGLALGDAPPELWVQDGFSRSDQQAFAEAGVPAVMVNEGFTWEHFTREQAVAKAVDWMMSVYHTPADDLSQELDYEAAGRHLQAIAALVLQIAEEQEMPRWHPGSAYAYERALAAARGR